MKTSLLVIRHGETDWNLSGRWQGHSDIPLNKNGLVQAQKLANRLSSWPIQAVYSSDLKRAAQTAAILAQEHGLEPTYDVAWRERNGGHFEGFTSAEFNQINSASIAQMSDKNWSPPGGETNVQVAQRVLDAYHRIITLHEGQMVAIISHGGAMITLLSSILGFPLGERAQLWVSSNTGINVIEVGERGAFLVRLNDDHHLTSSE